MKVIVPSCGRSSRYPNLPPKWLLPACDGRPMVALAVEKLKVKANELVLTILREHEQQFDATTGLRRALGDEATVIVLPAPTNNQAETVAQTLERLSLHEPFLVKDSDNVFALSDIEQSYNYVCVDSLNNYDSINPRNKSYVQIDHSDVIVNIREKEVISDLFCVGGYYFNDPTAFLETFAQLRNQQTEWHRELYISDIIGAMILDDVPFQARKISQYQDWGTVHEWKRAQQSRRVYFVQVDGFLFELGSSYFVPRFEDVKPNNDAIAAVKELAKHGHALVYLSQRPSELKQRTMQQLHAAGLPDGEIVMGCPIASWHLVTAPQPTLPFRTSFSHELSPQDPNLHEKLNNS